MDQRSFESDDGVTTLQDYFVQYERFAFGDARQITTFACENQSLSYSETDVDRVESQRIAGHQILDG